MWRFDTDAVRLSTHLTAKEEELMYSYLARSWWLAVLSGVLAIAFGVVALAWPGITFGSLVLVFGAFAFFDGVLVLAFGLWAAGSEVDQWWALVLAGIVGIATGVLTFARPAEMALALIYVIGLWAIVTGLLEIVAAIRLRKVIATEWLLGAGGALSIVFGVLVLWQPMTAAVTITWMFGIYAIVAGIAEIAFGIRLHGLEQTAPARAQGVPTGAH
jgi:uncharacterized membrane protein HdeD (DUF308 family)